jgi:hypothetical protein
VESVVLEVSVVLGLKVSVGLALGAVELVAWVGVTGRWTKPWPACSMGM